jgi:hypothetical protein
MAFGLYPPDILIFKFTTLGILTNPQIWSCDLVFDFWDEISSIWQGLPSV